MLVRRLLTAAAGIPLVVFIIFGLHEDIFFIFVLGVTAIALNELFVLASSDGAPAGRKLGIALGCSMPCSVFYVTRLGGWGSEGLSVLPLVCLSACVFVSSLYHMAVGGNKVRTFAGMSIQVLGICYIALPMSFVLLLRGHPAGAVLVFFLLVVTWAGDSGAYTVGRFFGKHALSPTVSPQKTIEGALGGFAFSLVAAFVLKSLVLQQVSTLDCIVLGAGINVTNQLGDLCESMMKRAFDAKDSGSILPGHGGMLDRIDSILFAAPFLFYYISIRVPEL